MVVDRQGRSFRNLRVSLTAACNYACTYCVPDGRRLVAASDELSAADMASAVTLLVEATEIDRLRITGGEPLVSAKLEPFLRLISGLEIKDISITSNGQLLAQRLPLLLEYGIRRLNVSLDTLDAQAFREIARSGDLGSVLHGLELARVAGVRIKVNMVPLRGANENQILPMLEYCLERGFELRFIELMRMGHLARDTANFSRQYFGMDEILELIGSQHTYIQAPAPLDSTALRYEIAGLGHFGIIANESAPFCRTCSRLRLSSSGWLYGCLSSSNRHALAPLLSKPHDEALSELQELLAGALADKRDSTFSGALIPMKAIGG
ncbi:radical SAM protein [Pseudomonas sp. SO81]|uniref:GTP 3',8-cyclase MoaA n=1 Tax=Pseudomonas sp. SO81 TaxID=2983246 RepID=UPI0025A3E74E|nr:radical SAM protein [Pseudomonas sp. SO81]WJN60750.1 GTP 3',8-cyclase [Pseudomonas sp. SO81]